MTEATLQEIHEDLEVLKRDVAELKSAILGEGELNDIVKARLAHYLQQGTKGVVSQEEIERKFA